MIRVGFYSFGKCHTIDKYFQIMSVIDLMIKSSKFTPIILTDGTGIADEDLKKKYSCKVDFADFETSVKSRLVDYIFIIDPYSRPKIPYKDIDIPIIYKEYGVAGVEAGTGYLLDRSSYRYSSIIFTDNSFYSGLIVSKYPEKSDNVFVCSPAFDYVNQRYKDLHFDRSMYHVLWTPHHSVESKDSFDLIEGGTYSTFLTYKDEILDLIEGTDIFLHIKPHPILGRRYNYYCSKHGIDDTFSRYKKRAISRGRVEFHEKENYHDLFMNCDMLINDSISFTLEWIPTMKPAIILEDSSKSKYSEYGENLISRCYERAGNFEELKSLVESLRKCDPKVNSKRYECRSLYMNPLTANSETILEIIAKDYFRRNGDSNK